MKNKKAQFTTKWIAYTAMLTALVVATNFIPAIPLGPGKIYWVDGVVLIAAFLMDPLSAFIAGGVGSFIYDIFWSPAMMIPSLVIHGLQGAIVSTLVHYVFPKKGEPLWAGIAAVIAAVEVIFGYFIYRCITSGAPYAWTKFPLNILQEVIGIAIGMVICYATTFKRQLKKNHLLPDFKREVLNENKKKKFVSECEETVTSGDILSFEDKYQGGGKSVIPADIPEAATENTDTPDEN